VAPALAGLAADISLAGFALGIERREGKIEVMLGRFAGVDGATREFWHGIVHGFPFADYRRDVLLGKSRDIAACS
jgi:hypothetical protein